MIFTQTSKGKRRTPAVAVEATPYDLYGTDSAARGTIPFAVTFPTEPTGPLTPITVTNNAQLATALATPSAEITVAAGSYNALNIASNDQHWILDNGATFAGLGGNGFARVKIEGGNIVTTGDVNPYNFEDLYLYNINIECDDCNFGLGTLMFSRLAVIHCTIYATRTGFFVPGATANDAGVWAYDLIAAANYVSGGMLPADPGIESAFRIQSVVRCILVDNRARCGFDNGGGDADVKHTFRSHYGDDKFWMRRNMTEFGDGIYFQARANNDPVVANNYMGDHWVYDHVIHTPYLSAYAFRGTGGGSIAANWPGVLTTAGNAGYTDQTLDDNWSWNAQAGDSIGSQTTAAYQAPPALGAWLAADGLPPGADH